MIQAASVTGSGQADELRQEMADGLVAEGWITSSPRGARLVSVAHAPLTNPEFAEALPACCKVRRRAVTA